MGRIKKLALLILTFVMLSADGCDDEYSKDYDISDFVVLYPNPTFGELTLKFKMLDKLDEPLPYRIHDLNGNIMEQGNFFNLINAINCDQYRSGTYLLVLGMNEFTFKFIKK